ncbi:sporulation protein [Paenibacillus aurantius]|uniref:Sporulation protein n=1 Tax=Paenibacillus aurantius TaxID=2918900 RepID=A0AA96L909_9BACL|nr:sporulation protein [Paenibacillus aurantius]WNQ08973.1 sporulation protein [Paenibacillus aurantius]
MFNKFLAKIGIGSAEIDTVLEQTHYTPGDEVRGEIRLRGGSVEQQIETIALSVMTEYIKESNDNKYHQRAEIARIHVTPPFLLQAGEGREIPFSFRLPARTPLTLGRTPVWIRTELEIQGAVDPSDNDRIEVYPSAEMRTVLDGVEEAGFRFRKAECEYTAHLGGGLPFLQEFEFTPTGRFRGRLDEVEIMFVGQDEGGIDLLLQIDRRARGLSSLFAEAFDMDESFVRLRLSSGELAGGPHAVAGTLSGIIERYAK